MALQAVLFDVDFTLVMPGPELGPEAYRSLAETHGLQLDLELYGDARVAAIADLEGLDGAGTRVRLRWSALGDSVDGPLAEEFAGAKRAALARLERVLNARRLAVVGQS